MELKSSCGVRQNYAWNSFKLLEIQRRHRMTVRRGSGRNEKIALPNDPAAGLQISPELRVFPGFGQRKRQHGVILQHAFHKTDTAIPDSCVRGTGAAVQEFRCRDGGDKKQIVGVSGQKCIKVEPPPLAGDKERSVNDYSHTTAFGGF